MRMDIVGPIGTDEKSPQYFLLATYCSPKWIEGKVYKKICSNQVAEFIKQNIINIYDVQAYIITDRGKHFHCRQVEDLEAQYGF